MKSREQFAATGRNEEQIADLLTADSLGYTSMEGLMEALDIPENSLCLACLTGEYPTSIPGEKMRFQKTLEVA